MTGGRKGDWVQVQDGPDPRSVLLVLFHELLEPFRVRLSFDDHVAEVGTPLMAAVEDDAPAVQIVLGGRVLLPTVLDEDSGGPCGDAELDPRRAVGHLGDVDRLAVDPQAGVVAVALVRPRVAYIVLLVEKYVVGHADLHGEF